MHDDAPRQPDPSKPIVGGYRIERLIGVGGAAAVYEARRLGRGGPGERVACKVLHWRGDPMHRALAWREAVLGLRCTPGHANLVEYLDFLDDAEAQLCIVMELVDGVSVFELREPGQRLPFPVARRIAVDVLAALAYLHGRGVLHRDLSLGNILVTRGGVVKVADFGLARVMEQGQVHTGTVLGTAMYMSPETVQMLPLDGRSDLFSLAAILFDLVVGMPPCGDHEFNGARLARNGAGIFEPLPPDMPPDLAELLTGLLRKDRNARRPQTVAEALALLRDRDQVIASPEGLAVLVEDAQSRREAALAATLAAVRPPHVLAPGHVLAQRRTKPEGADGASPERKPEGAVEVLPAGPAEHAVEVLPAGHRSGVGDAASAVADRAAGGAVNPLPGLVGHFGPELIARLVDEIGPDPRPGQMIEVSADAISERVADHAADAPLDRGAGRAADAVPEHIDDVLPDGLAGHAPALEPELAAEALSDRASDATSGGALQRRSRLGARVAPRRVLAAAIVACALVLGFMLGGRRGVEHDVPARPQPPDLPAPIAGPAPRAPWATGPVAVTPGPREQAGATAAGHPDGPRGKRFEARRRARLSGPAPTRWEPVPLGGEPPPWGAR
jgi:hypothetical protein